MNALPWQDQILIALAAFAVVGALGLAIWCLIGTIEDVPQPELRGPRADWRTHNPGAVDQGAGLGHSSDRRGSKWATSLIRARGRLPGGPPATPIASPVLWAEPSEEDTLTWLARVHEETPGRAPDEARGSGPARPGGDRLDQLAAAFAADTIIDARIRDWLDELIEKGLDGYRSADEWVAARMSALAVPS